MSFGKGLAFAYRESWAFACKAWWLLLLPVLPRLAWDISASASLLPDPSPLSTHLLNCLLSFCESVQTYWILRFVALNGNSRAALTVNAASVRSFFPYLVLAIGEWWGSVFAFAAGTTVLIVSGLLIVIVQALLAPWIVTAPSGSNSIGPIRAIRLGSRHILWSAALLMIVVLPIEWVGELGVAQLSGSGSPEWAQATFATLIGQIENLIFCVATFPIAYRAGVTINSNPGLAEAFT